VPKLLAMLSLKATIVTADALNCQRDIAQQIVGQGGDYALALKGNQGTLHDDVRLFRAHRGIENQLHWRLDVVMNEDQDRSRLDHAPQNLAVLRHMALNVMQKDPTKGSLRGKFKRAGWDDTYLSKLLDLF